MPLAACTSPADSQTGRHGGREAGRQEGREGVTQTTIKLTSHAAHKPDGFISPNNAFLGLLDQDSRRRGASACQHIVSEKTITQKTTELNFLCDIATS